jgi:hypothetical protein
MDKRQPLDVPDRARASAQASSTAYSRRKPVARRLAEQAGFGAVLLAVAAGSFGLVTRYVLPDEAPTPSSLAELERGRHLQHAATLARESLTTLAEAHRNNDYRRFWLASSPAFQAVNTPERLSAIFAGQRAYNLDIAAVVVAPPRWLEAPRIDASGQLRLRALYPVAGQWLDAQLAYDATAGTWRLDDIELSLRPAAG